MQQKLDLIINLIKNQGVSLNSKIDDLREEMNGKYNSLNGKYDSLRLDVSCIEQKVDNLSIQLEGLKDYTYGTITTKLDNLSNQVTVLEDYAHEKCEGALDGWLSHLEKQEEIKNNVTNLNSKTENHEIRISVLEDVLEA